MAVENNVMGVSATNSYADQIAVLDDIFSFLLSLWLLIASIIA